MTPKYFIQNYVNIKLSTMNWLTCASAKCLSGTFLVREYTMKVVSCITVVCPKGPCSEQILDI